VLGSSAGQSVANDSKRFLTIDLCLNQPVHHLYLSVLENVECRCASASSQEELV